MASSLITPVILCGGAGARLWPISRESLPKQFARLVGPVSTFQQVVNRVSDKDVFAQPIIITNGELRFLVAEQLRACGVECQVVLEPVRRDSGPAVTAAAELVRRRDETGLVLVVASDHVVPRPKEFVAVCHAASAAAAEGWIVTFGIPPRSAATGYGYIQPGKQVNGAAVLAVEAFAEKPDNDTAIRYVADGYLWNSGNFLFRADVMLEEIARFEPVMADSVHAAVDGAAEDPDFLRLAEQPFTRAPKKSIDYAVMERTIRAAVIRSDFEWSDVGNWDEVWKIENRDENGNATDGLVELLDTRGSLVRSQDDVLTTVVGCEDIVVISSADAVLVIPRKRAELVKSLVEILKMKNRREVIEHGAGPRWQKPSGFAPPADTSTVKR